MYEMNRCSTFWNEVPRTQFNIQITRILLITVLFLLSLLYIIISFILRKSIHNLKQQDVSEAKLMAQQAYYQDWDQEYMLMLGDHAVAIGFVICFSPYEFEIILAMGYFILRLIYEIKLHKSNVRLKVIKTILRIINMGLLVCAMVGLSRSQFGEGDCRDSYYRFNE